MSSQKKIALSVNLNKIALIRNSREGNNPDIIMHARKCIAAGAAGLTIHPRPDQRHAKPEDCNELKQLITSLKIDNSALEFNIEGNPFAGTSPALRNDFNDYPGFMAILAENRPDQATLVPDSNTQLTSDHGFDLTGNTHELKKIIEQIKQIGSRISLFMDPDLEQIARARDIGADRIELYTGPFADAYEEKNLTLADKIFKQHCKAANYANEIGLGVNAGHDLNLNNLTLYRKLPHLAEVSIGHALTIDSLEQGLTPAIHHYLSVLDQRS